MTEPTHSDDALRALYRDWDRDVDYEREAERLAARLRARSSKGVSALTVLAIAAGIVVVGVVAWTVVGGVPGDGPNAASPQDPEVTPRRSDLLLPRGPAATPVSDLESPVFVDVTHDGRVEHGGKAWYSEEDDDHDRTEMLQLLLYLKETRMRAPRRIVRFPQGEHTTARALVDAPLVIRADRSADWSIVAELIAQCEKPEATIWNVHLAAATPELGAFSIALPLDPEDRLFGADVDRCLPIRIVVEQVGEPSERAVPIESEQLPEHRRPGIDLTGHSLRWDLGPKSFTDLEDLRVELRRVLGDQARLAADPRVQELLPLAIALQVGPHAWYSDVVETLEAITRAHDASDLGEPVRVVIRPMR